MTDQPKWQRTREELEARKLVLETRARPLGVTPPFARALQKAMQPILKVAGPSPGTLAAQWPEIVGQRLAAVTHPIRVQPAKGGATLHIRAPSAAAPMIQHAQEGILQKVRMATGYDIVKIKIDQTAGAPPKPKTPPPKLTEEQRVNLTESLVSVKTGPLNKALAQLGEAVLAQPATRPKRK